MMLCIRCTCAVISTKMIPKKKPRFIPSQYVLTGYISAIVFRVCCMPAIPTHRLSGVGRVCVYIKKQKKFREIAEAAEVLSDAELRGKYDRGEDVQPGIPSYLHSRLFRLAYHV